MDLSTQFVKKLARSIEKDTVSLTLDLGNIPYALMIHQSKSQLNSKIKQARKEADDEVECSITNYFNYIDTENVQKFIERASA